MDKPDGVVGEQGIGAAGDFAVMADVVGGIGGAHSGDVVAPIMCYRTIFGVSFRVGRTSLSPNMRMARAW